VKISSPFTRIALGAVAAAAVLAPAPALAARYDGPDALTRYALGHQLTTVRPDDRGGIRGAGPSVTTSPVASTASSPALAPRPDNRAGFLGEHPAQAVDATSTTGGFQWGDAGIGLGTAVGLMLFALAAGLVLRRERSAQHA
jgi:hypothetical protein